MGLNRLRLAALALLAAIVPACGGSSSTVQNITTAIGPAGLRTWSVPEVMEFLAFAVASPVVGADATGNAVAAWVQNDGVQNSVWAGRFPIVAGVAFPGQIETDATHATSSPQIAVNASGVAVVVWNQPNGGAIFEVWSNRFVPGAGWGTALLISNDPLNNALNPQVALDPAGNAIAVWDQSDGVRANILSNRFAVGTGWGTPAPIETDNAGDASAPRVAADPAGNAVAAWTQSDGTRFNIWANRYVAGTGWGTAQLIETDNAGNAVSADVAIDASGNAIAVWSQNDGTRNNAWSNRFVPGTGWGTAALLETDNAGAAVIPRVAMSPNGRAVAVWAQSDGVAFRVRGNQFVPGVGWGTAQLVSVNNGSNVFQPRVGIDAGGNAVAAWYQTGVGGGNAWANHFDATAGWGAAQLLETDDAGTVSAVELSVAPDGSAVAVWAQNDGANVNLYVSRYR